MDRLEKALKVRKIDDAIIQQILTAGYKPSQNQKQSNVNQCAAAMKKCDELLEFDTIAKVMSERSCCKTGKRLNDVKNLAKEYGSETLEKKLTLLGEVQYMGHPYLTKEGYIATGGCAGTWRDDHFDCSCWSFQGHTPEEDPMPASYCLCCAGHFTFHYQKALGLKLKVKEVENSAFLDNTKPCSFLFEIVS